MAWSFGSTEKASHSSIEHRICRKKTRIIRTGVMFGLLCIFVGLWRMKSYTFHGDDHFRRDKGTVFPRSYVDIHRYAHTSECPHIRNKCPSLCGTEEIDAHYNEQMWLITSRNAIILSARDHGFCWRYWGRGKQAYQFRDSWSLKYL